MPIVDVALARTPAKEKITVSLEPVRNLLFSLLLLNQVDNLSGLPDWVTRTAAALTPEQRQTNRLLFEGLHSAFDPKRHWSDFKAYIDRLSAEDPRALRDRVLAGYDTCCRKAGNAPLAASQPAEVLASPDTFLDYLRSAFPDEAIDVALETEAYKLLADPPALQAKITSHLRMMWEEVLAPEWKRIEPMLQTAVDAFQQLDFTNIPPLDAALEIMGQPVPEEWRHNLEDEKLRQVIFAPSAHLGPYRGLNTSEDTVWLFFGARLPEGTHVSSPELSRSELLVRLSALADDTRLLILHTVKTQGESCSKDIIEQLDLSQSAASRHLKQLSATGYLSERRQNGAKCYSLNEDRAENTLQALSNFLLG